MAQVDVEVARMRDLVDAVALILQKKGWGTDYDFDQLHDVAKACYKPDIDQYDLFNNATEVLKQEIPDAAEIECQMLPTEEPQATRRKRRLSGGGTGYMSKTPRLQPGGRQTPANRGLPIQYDTDSDRDSQAASVASSMPPRSESTAYGDMLPQQVWSTAPQVPLPWPQPGTEVPVFQPLVNVVAGFTIGSQHGLSCTAEMLTEIKKAPHELVPTHAVVIFSEEETKDKLLAFAKSLEDKQLFDLIDEPKASSLFKSGVSPTQEGFLFTYTPVFFLNENDEAEWARALKFIHNARTQDEHHVVAVMCDSEFGGLSTQLLMQYCIATGVLTDLRYLTRFFKGGNHHMHLLDAQVDALDEFSRSIELRFGQVLLSLEEPIAPPEVTDALALQDHIQLAKFFAQYLKWCDGAYKEQSPAYQNWKRLQECVMVKVEEEQAAKEKAFGFKPEEEATLVVPDPFEDDFKETAKTNSSIAINL